VSLRNVEEIRDYEAPAAEVADLAKEANKLPPLCNYPGEGFQHMTAAKYKATYSDYKGTLEAGQGAKNHWDRCVMGAPEGVGRHRVRVLFCFQGGGKSTIQGVFLTDTKETKPPKIEDSMSARPVLPGPVREVYASTYKAPEATVFDALKDTLKAGVQVVTANQLFPTPNDIARRMVELADIQRGDRILEPSAGTGAILGALGCRMFAEPSDVPYLERDQVRAVEINSKLAARLEVEFPPFKTHCADFLTLTGDDLGMFQKILMNPPFENGSDIKHIQHALGFLADGGRLVGICANGPRQNDQIKPRASEWHILPAGTFAGTNVTAALFVIGG
jgi:hypothetical protein